MRFLVLALVLIGFLCPAEADAQRFRPELKIGLATSTFRGSTTTDFGYITGLAGGAAFGYDFGNGMMIQPEVLYAVKGATARTSIAGLDEEGAVVEIPVDATFELTYLELPLLLIYRFETRGGLHPRLFAGPALSFRLDAFVRFQAVSGGPVQEEDDDTVKGSDLGFVLGGGVEIDVGGQRVVTGLRGNFGISNARDAEPALYNTSVGLFVGIVIQ